MVPLILSESFLSLITIGHQVSLQARGSTLYLLSKYMFGAQTDPTSPCIN